MPRKKETKSLSESERFILDHTRVHTKVRKTWQGRRKPPPVYTDEDDKLEKESKKALDEFFKFGFRFTKRKKQYENPGWMSYDDEGNTKNTFNFFTCPYCSEGYNHWEKHQPTCPVYIPDCMLK